MSDILVTCDDMWWPQGASDMSHLMRLCRDDCQLWYWSDNSPGLVTSLHSPGEDIIRVIIVIIVIVTRSLVVIDTAQSDEQACDFQNWPMIISNTIWDKHEQNARSLIWSPINC